MLLKETNKTPLTSLAQYHQISFEGKNFRRYLKYKYVTLFAQGEFPGNVFADQGKIQAIDFISPPEILSIETRPDKEVTWFKGEYIHPSILKNQAAETLPSRRGIAPAQPKIKVDNSMLIASSVFALILVGLVQFLSTMNSAEKTILRSTYKFPESLYRQTYVTPKFNLEKWKSNLQLDIESPVSNSWFELEATLVNANDGTEYTLEQGVEHYWGTDGGESWSEGGTSATAYFSSIPAGTYFFQVTGEREVKYMMVDEFTVKVVNDTPMNLNLIIALILVLIWPAVLGLISYYNEYERWANSPYSTFSKN